MDTYRGTMITIALVFSMFFTVPGDSRSVNISSSWLLPQNDFPVFYRHFRDRVTWFEADAVCQFHHAQLATVESSRQFESIRGYLKELDVIENVWIGLKRNSEASEFTWTNYQPLAKSGYFRETVPRSPDPVCVVTDPTANFKWHSLHCGGPEVASFVCELPVPYWASKSNGCMTSMVEGMTVTFLPEQPAIQLTKECSQGISKNVTCKGNMKQSEIMEKLSCPSTNKLLKPFFKPVKPILDEMSLRTTTSSTESDVEDYAIEMATIAQYNDETFQTISRVIGQGRNVNLPQEMSIAQEPIKVSGRGGVMNNNGIYSAFVNSISTTSTSTHVSTTTKTSTTSGEVTSTTPTVKPNTFTVVPSAIGKRIVPIIFDTTTTTTVKAPTTSTYATTEKSTTIRATTEGLTTTTTTTDSASSSSIATTTGNHHQYQYHKPTTITKATLADRSPITVKISSTEKTPSTEKIHIVARVLTTEMTADDHRPPSTTLKATSASQTISNKRAMPTVPIINAKIPYTVRPVTAKAAVITTQKPYVVVDEVKYQTTGYPVKHIYKKIDLPALPMSDYDPYKPSVITNIITTQKPYDEIVKEVKNRATERPIKRVYKKIDIPTFPTSDFIPYKPTMTNADGFTTSHFNHTIAATSTSGITTETASKKTTTTAQQLTAPPGTTVTSTSKVHSTSSSTTTDPTTVRTTIASVGSTENDNRTSTEFVKDDTDSDHKLFALKWNPTTPSSSSSLPTTSSATTSAALTNAATKATTTAAADITTAGAADITTTTIASTASTTHHKINYNAYTEHPNHSRHIIRPKQQHHHSYPYILYRLLG